MQANSVVFKYVIVRGATIRELINPAVQELREAPQNWPVVVKIAAGINDVTQLITTEQGKVIVSSNKSSEDIIQELVRFKRILQEYREDALVGFVTIPTACVGKFQQYQNNRVTLLSDLAISVEQLRIERLVRRVNTKILAANSVYQYGPQGTPRQVYWHSTITRPSKRRDLDGNQVTARRNNERYLYDGLHAISSIKQKWFRELYKAVRKEAETLSQRYWEKRRREFCAGSFRRRH